MCGSLSFLSYRVFVLEAARELSKAHHSEDLGPGGCLFESLHQLQKCGKLTDYTFHPPFHVVLLHV